MITAAAERWIPLDNALVVVATYTLGMAVFTMIMGNAFAAFPVMTAGIGLPLIVHKFGGNPAIMASIGMVSGYCGTLMTPMAANFNIVPAALLELPDEYAVIKRQIPTAIPLLAGQYGADVLAGFPVLMPLPQTTTADIARRVRGDRPEPCAARVSGKTRPCDQRAGGSSRPARAPSLFYGSFGWHSCVHGYWLLARLYRRFPASTHAPTSTRCSTNSFRRPTWRGSSPISVSRCAPDSSVPMGGRGS